MSLLDTQELINSTNSDTIIISICGRYIQKYLIESYKNLTGCKYHGFTYTNINFDDVLNNPINYFLCINIFNGEVHAAIFEKNMFDTHVHKINNYGKNWYPILGTTLKDVIDDAYM